MQPPAKPHHGGVLQAAQLGTQAVPSAQPPPPLQIVAPVAYPQTRLPSAAGLTAPHTSAHAAHTASAAPAAMVVPTPALEPVAVSAPVLMSMPSPQLESMPATLPVPASQATAAPAAEGMTAPTAAATTHADSAAAEGELGTILQQELDISPSAADLLAELEIDIHTSDADHLRKAVVLLANTTVAYQEKVSTVLGAAHDQLLGLPRLGSTAAGGKRAVARRVRSSKVVKQELRVRCTSQPAKHKQQQQEVGTSKPAGQQQQPAGTGASEPGGLVLQRIRGPSPYGSKSAVQVWRCRLEDEFYFVAEDAIQLRGTQRTTKATSTVSLWPDLG